MCIHTQLGISSGPQFWVPERCERNLTAPDLCASDMPATPFELAPCWSPLLRVLCAGCTVLLAAPFSQAELGPPLSCFLGVCAESKVVNFSV